MSKKSKVLHLSRSKDPYHHEYWLSDKPLSAVDHHKHVDVWLESSRSWDYHINYICAEANKDLGLIRRTFGPNNSEGVSTEYTDLSASNFGIWLSGLESVFSEAHQKYRVNTEASHSSYLRIRERISGETWGTEMAFT